MKTKFTSKENKKNIKIVNPLKPTLSSCNFDLYCKVKIKNKSFKIYCGDGKQKLSWLSDTILYKFDKNFGLCTGNYFLKRVDCCFKTNGWHYYN
jgi:hypothetical protein